jgi:histidinol-phosphate aminotransferase
MNRHASRSGRAVRYDQRFVRATTITMTIPVRPAVLASPEYPFNPIDAPVKLDQNESPDDFPAELKQLVAQRLVDAAWNRYPDLHSDALCAAIGRHEDWDPAGVVVTTGSNVLIPLLTQMSGLGRRLVTVKPHFALYALAAQLQEVALTEVPLQPDLSLDIPALKDALRSGGAPGVLFVSQPHAPAGSLAAFGDIVSLVDAADGWLVVIDEAYCHFGDSDYRAFARARPNVVLLRTFSKAWGLAGLRMGYLLAPPGIASNLKKLIPPFATSIVQTVATQVALENPQFMVERVRHIVAERERMFAALRAHATWTVYPSSGNFLLIRTPDARAAHAHLLAQGVLVRRQDSYHGLEGCIRVSVGTAAENDRFLAAALAAR